MNEFIFLANISLISQLTNIYTCRIFEQIHTITVSLTWFFSLHPVLSSTSSSFRIPTPVPIRSAWTLDASYRFVSLYQLSRHSKPSENVKALRCECPASSLYANQSRPSAVSHRSNTRKLTDRDIRSSRGNDASRTVVVILTRRTSNKGTEEAELAVPNSKSIPVLEKVFSQIIEKFNPRSLVDISCENR